MAKCVVIISRIETGSIILDLPDWSSREQRNKALRAYLAKDGPIKIEELSGWAIDDWDALDE